MKTLLIIPPAPFLLSSTSVLNLGILYVASYIEKIGFKPVILDLLGEQEYIKIVSQKIIDEDWDCVGITLTTSQAKYAIEISKVIKSLKPNLRIIAGGPHITYTYLSHQKQKLRNQRMMDDLEKYFDVCVVGDGEKSFEYALSTTSKFLNATITTSPLYMSASDLEKAPFPAYHLLNLKKYNYTLSSRELTSTDFSDEVISLISQRGCPYGCRFCAGANNIFFKKIRKIETSKTVKEVEHLYLTYGYKRFAFYDDELNVSDRLNDLLDGLQSLQMKYGVDMSFRGFLKANLITKEQVKKLKTTGFVMASIGLESGSERILKNINKHATVAQNTAALDILRESGIYDKCSISIGHPGESHRTIEETFSWLTAMRLNDVGFMIVSLLPSSAYYDASVQKSDGIWVYTAPDTGDKLFSETIDYHTHSNFFYEEKSYVWTEYLTAQEIVNYWMQLRKTFKKIT
jgi:anaerobic magnesium-protoporphyrin IX monomethyl ester cyclase